MADLSADTDFECWTLKQIYRHYLVNSPDADGRSAEEVIQACFAQRRIEDNDFNRFGSTDKDRRLYEDRVKAVDDRIEKVVTDVRRLMLAEAGKENWIALGRRSPDSDHELIPPRYWPFLTLDLENNAATGEGLLFRDLRCRLIEDVPDDDPIQEVLGRARNRPSKVDQHNGSRAGQQPVCAPSTVPDQTQEIAHTGAPGRPSSMHLVKAEFERRCRQSEILASVRAEAEHLGAWFKANHPKAPRPTARTIENRIRTDYRTAKHALSNPTK